MTVRRMQVGSNWRVVEAAAREATVGKAPALPRLSAAEWGAMMGTRPVELDVARAAKVQRKAGVFNGIRLSPKAVR